jgi:arylsulfatase A-like enzyme
MHNLLGYTGMYDAKKRAMADVQPMCSPTRSATMSGRYTIRLGTQSNTLAVNAPWGINLNETFLPQNLQDAGYRTAMWGKV